MEMGTLKIYQRDEIIYNQGDPSPDVYFILRGSIALSVKKKDMGHQNVTIKIMYDG
jgi:CRP-like cAMP-binding protein